MIAKSGDSVMCSASCAPNHRRRTRYVPWVELPSDVQLSRGCCAVQLGFRCSTRRASGTPVTSFIVTL